MTYSPKDCDYIRDGSGTVCGYPIAQVKEWINEFGWYRVPSQMDPNQEACCRTPDGITIHATRYWWDGKGPFHTINHAYPDYHGRPAPAYMDPDSPAVKLLAEIEAECPSTWEMWRDGWPPTKRKAITKPIERGCKHTDRNRNADVLWTSEKR